jgi:hypothetical protein
MDKSKSQKTQNLVTPSSVKSADEIAFEQLVTELQKGNQFSLKDLRGLIKRIIT